MESMEAESQGSTRWNFETLNKATREWRLKLWDQATEQVYGKSRQGRRWYANNNNGRVHVPSAYDILCSSYDHSTEEMNQEASPERVGFSCA